MWDITVAYAEVQSVSESTRFCVQYWHGDDLLAEVVDKTYKRFFWQLVPVGHKGRRLGISWTGVVRLLEERLDED